MNYYVVEREGNVNIADSRLTNIRPVSILLDKGDAANSTLSPIMQGSMFYRYISLDEHDYLVNTFKIRRTDIQTDAVKTARIPTPDGWKKISSHHFHFTPEFCQYQDEAFCKLALPAMPVFRMKFYIMQDVPVAYMGDIISRYKEKTTCTKELYVEENDQPEGILVSVNSRSGFEYLY